ncbi:unnamed protein product [Adineta steineri]|uniref:EF-hand domain-containing protein n=1 Tax=Adineta steineri TaxID=433720 RepID=A0A814MRF5_9BILA|nr:unnamed protein product [Adineta steineri]
MSSSKSKTGRSSAQNIETSGTRKVHSRHTWKLESISHGKGQPVSRKAIQHVQDEVAKRKDKFHFSKQEIESLCTIFRHLTKSDRIDRPRFRDVLHNTFDMTDDILMDRVFKAFDRDNDGQVSMLEWVVGLNTYLRGTLDEKIAFVLMASVALSIVKGLAETHMESLKETVAAGETQQLSTDERIRRLRQKGEDAKKAFDKGVDTVVINAEAKNPGPSATSKEKANYNIFLEEVTSGLGKISQWIELYQKWSIMRRAYSMVSRAGGLAYGEC